MEPFTSQKSPSGKDYSACSGCGLCLLPCPVWRQTRDIVFTWQGRARALQQGATSEELTDSLFACTNCGACDPICPERIDLRGTMAKLRGEHKENPLADEIRHSMEEALKKPLYSKKKADFLLIAGENLKNVDRIMSLFSEKGSIDLVCNNGRDITLAMEAGLEIPRERLDRFINPLKSAREIIVSDGILKQPLKHLLPGSRVRGLGEALSSLPQIRKKIKPSDFYIIESRSYNSDFEAMVGHYDKLRKETGATFNLDLNRIAIPTTASSIQQVLGFAKIDISKQIKWLLEGREVKRVIAERQEDGEAFRASCNIPVILLSDLAKDKT